MHTNKHIQDINFEKISEILNSSDQKASFTRVNIIPDESELLKRLENQIKFGNFCNKSVLGIDIYQYSSYPDFEQTMIPVVFKILFDETIELCLQTQQYLFQKYTQNTIINHFISTGDGGFLIFDTPIHAVAFACNFEIVRRSYNSYHLYPRLRKITGGISLRYAITYDKIYKFENNFYGKAIIHNARILNKDNLNRCLIDQNTHEWFLINLDGVENLQVISINEISNIHEFQDYDSSLVIKGRNELFHHAENSRRYGIINADILKIGTITSKHTQLTVYNIHLQITINMFSSEPDGTNRRTITVSLGNLNTSGI